MIEDVITPEQFKNHIENNLQLARYVSEFNSYLKYGGTLPRIYKFKTNDMAAKNFLKRVGIAGWTVKAKNIKGAIVIMIDAPTPN